MKENNILDSLYFQVLTLQSWKPVNEQANTHQLWEKERFQIGFK